MKKTRIIGREDQDSGGFVYAALFSGAIGTILLIVGYLFYYLLTHERELPSGGLF